ncbi:MAG: aminotransferase class V-fold PLP-dependent enzyme [Rhodobacteraceae bacterium]|nr:aminotransferase class V-fold PLP-dependent enzyme [Paracoccaceae bacterium]
MLGSNENLLKEVRARFAHVDACPFQGERIFFENAGGALTLKSVVSRTAEYAAIPDNQGRDNPASHELVRVIDQARKDMHLFLNASSGQVFFGESGTEVLFRMISTACLGTAPGGNVVSSTVEHPATRSAAIRWAEIAGKELITVVHNDETGDVTAQNYAKVVNKDTRVATILHTSPVTGIGNDVGEISKVIRAVSPDCIIIVDGIQHAAHGLLDIDSYDIDGYAVSPYKMFSRHGYGVGWISDRLTDVPHNMLLNGPAKQWELGTRDTGAYATLSEVIRYFEWLGSEVSEESDPRAKIVAAGQAILAHEETLTNAMLHGTGNLKGLADMKDVIVLAGIDNPHREGLVSFMINGRNAVDIVAYMNEQGIRTHVRKADHYSANILTPLKQDSCVRVSFCHYNTEQEVSRFLNAMTSFLA